MLTDTFPRMGSGSKTDPITPNFTSLGYTPAVWEAISETADTFTVRYEPQNP